MGVQTQISQIIVFSVCVHINIKIVRLMKTSVTENCLHPKISSMVRISLGREELVRTRGGRNGEKEVNL